MRATPVAPRPDRQRSPEIGTRRLVGFFGALFPIPQRPERDLILHRKFFLCQPERAANDLGAWRRLHAIHVGVRKRLRVRIGNSGGVTLLVSHRIKLEHRGVTPDRGDVLVTGASGGVGSIAIALLARRGFRALAPTGRPAEVDFPQALGADEIIDRHTLPESGKPLGRRRRIDALDAVGSHTLANVLAQTRYGGIATACGVVQGLHLPASVTPFILCGATLAGIDSVNAPPPKRREAWVHLAGELDLESLAWVTTEIGLAAVPEAARRLLAGHVRGRTAVDVTA